jgi:RNA polymerase sigma-70 factor (ECF subfamily)
VGTTDSLETWLAESYATSFRTACLILHNRADAEEAVQDAFLRAWRFRASMPEGEAVKPWLYRVVVNACLSKARRHRPATTDVDAVGGQLADKRSDSPESMAELDESGAALLAALRRLPEPLRVVIVLRYFAGLKEAEIAAAIRRRPGTVKSRLHEARRRLAEDAALAGSVLIAEEA